MTESRGRRGQIISACNSCWKRKIRCDSGKPKCSWCVHYKTTCIYQRDGNRHCQSRQINSRMGEASREDPPLEVPCDARQPNDSFSLNDPLPSLALAALVRLPASAIVDQEWTRFKTGELVSTDILCRDRFCHRDSLPLNPHPSSIGRTESHTIDAMILPDRGRVEKYTSLYMRSMIRVTFPVLNSFLFEKTMSLAYDSNDDEHAHVVSARACIIAFSMFAYLVPLGVQFCSKTKYNEYAALLQRNLLEVAKAATVDGFQACIFLLLSQFFTSKLKSATVTNSIAAHFVFHFGAHLTNPMQPFMLTQGSLLELTRTHLRNLFWVCYTIDKDLCLRVRQPPALSDNYCDLALPLQYLEEISKDFTISLVSDQVHPSLMFPTDLKISQIKSQAYELLYSVPAFRKSNMELLMNIQNLSDSLEKCRLAVPEIERPSLSRRDTGKIGIRTMVSQLDYLHCMAVIHQASNRCLGDGMNYYGAAIVNTSGISLAVEASRSSLRYLQSVYHNLNEGSFWLVFFYPLSASIVILCNILDNPALPSALQDYELLKGVPGLMCGIPTHSLNAAELLHREHLESFVKDLIRAAQYSISSGSGSAP